jgi:hypothetical protein
MFIKEEAKKRLEAQLILDKPDTIWPDGYYGAINAPLLFVGPSPGGGNIDGEFAPRSKSGANAYWNFDFVEPFKEWSNGFRNSLKPIIESLLDISLEEGGYKLFAFANFDWIQNPDASKVPEARMQEGIDEVKALINVMNPKIIIALEKRAYKILVKLFLQEGYKLLPPITKNVHILYTKSRFHHDIDCWTIEGNGKLKGSLLVRSPQHPARIFNAEYAKRVSTALKEACIALWTNQSLNIELISENN